MSTERSTPEKSIFSALSRIGSCGILSAIAVLASPMGAFAAGGDGGEHGIASLLPFYFNFTVYSFIVFLLVRKPFLSAWKSRRELLIELATKGERELKAAEVALSNAERRYSSLANEIETLTRQIKGDTVREGEQILEDSRRRAEQLLQQAEVMVKAEDRAMQSQIRRQVVEKAVEQARKQLTAEMTDEVDASLRRGVSTGLKALVQ